MILTTYSPVGNSRTGHVRALAARLLKEAGVSAPPVPIDELVAAQGLAITDGDIPEGWGYFDPQAWVIRLAHELFAETPGNRNRRRFTVAHELGHCVLEHGDASCWNLGVAAEPYEFGELDDFPDFEQEAHQFARELLVPRPWLKRDWSANNDAQHWADVYGVSRATLFIVVIERRLLMRSQLRRR